MSPSEPTTTAATPEPERPTEALTIWTGVRNSNGYGSFLVSNTPHVRMYAHRFAYTQVHGAIPDGLHVLHSCDNPPCVNPAHLSLGTAADNARDKSAKGRAWRPTCAKGHEWTLENTAWVRGGKARRCRTCRRARERTA